MPTSPGATQRKEERLFKNAHRGRKPVSWSSVTEDSDGPPPTSWGFLLQGKSANGESQATKFVPKISSFYYHFY